MNYALLFVLVQATAPLGVVTDWIRGDQDIIHYDITLAIPARGTSITGEVHLRYVVRDGEGPLLLDFDRHFAIDSLLAVLPQSAEAVEWEWTEREDSDVLSIRHWGRPGDTLCVSVHYRGSPADGLIIGSNVHGDRTVFADNWPNRAHHWFPAEDHPSDKATVDFAVTVPARWSVVANGRLAGVDTIAVGWAVWRWSEPRPIPVHTMVIGAGVLGMSELGDVGAVPQSVWAFPRDSAFAVNVPFRRAREMVQVLRDAIGPFPYDKLAHVQSATRYGGMENSSAIFYNQHAYARRTMGEGVVAHEIAHQWFGDAVAQADWHHLWLSEGFATYFGDLTFALLGEPRRFLDAMASGRDRYLRSDHVERPVIDTTEHDLMALLNANNYQKGSWILHMLRAEVGDSAFLGIIKDYYATFRDSSVLTNDFAAVVSRHAGRSMEWFFEQWLLQPGYPQIQIRWRHDAGGRTIVLEIDQVQPREWGVFTFRLPLEARSASGSSESFVARVTERQWIGEIPVRDVPAELLVDPEETLLLEVLEIAGPS
jgi:aminopeptidase N